MNEDDNKTMKTHPIPLKPTKNRGISPLKPMKTFLTIARYIGGFPLIPTNEEVTTFSFSNSSYIGLCAVVILIVGSHAAQFCILGRYGINFGQVFQEFQKAGLSITDLLALDASFAINALALLGFMYAYRYSAEPMTKVYGYVAQTPYLTLNDDDLNKPYQSIKTMGILYVIIALLSTVTVGYSLAIYNSRLIPGQPIVVVLMSGLFCIGHFKAFMPTIALTSQFIMLQTLSIFVMLLEKFELILDSSLKTEDTSDNEKIISLGLHLHLVKSKLELLFSYALIIEFIITLITMVFGMFLSMSAYGAFDQDGNVNKIMLGFCVTHAFLSVLSIFRLVSLIAKGQRIVKTYSSIRYKLEDILMKNFRSFGEEDICQMNVLIERFATKSAVRPLDCFDMTYPTGISLVGVLLTYIIVLMQFRIGQ